ncbi:MAG: low molecular weight protein-tyrosine-phosphatase [Myxococcota bacterium]
MAVRICFVCLGNICRSPTAEAAMRHLVDSEGLAHAFHLDSAGTGAWHEGEPPDRRATATAKRRGVTLEGRARRFDREDFSRFDYVIAMDQNNYRHLQELAPTESDRRRVVLFRDFDPDGPRGAEVPDPYYGGQDGFEHVLDVCLSAARGLLHHVRKKHTL